MASRSSGVTIGIGYDLGYAAMQDVAEDWLPYIGAAATDLLQTVRGITGLPAREAAANIRSVEIDWNAAHSNFVSVLTNLYAGETIRYFPNSDQLSADSLWCIGFFGLQ